MIVRMFLDLDFAVARVGFQTFFTEQFSIIILTGIQVSLSPHTHIQIIAEFAALYVNWTRCSAIGFASNNVINHQKSLSSICSISYVASAYLSPEECLLIFQACACITLYTRFKPVHPHVICLATPATSGETDERKLLSTPVLPLLESFHDSCAGLIEWQFCRCACVAHIISICPQKLCWTVTWLDLVHFATHYTCDDDCLMLFWVLLDAFIYSMRPRQTGRVVKLAIRGTETLQQ